MADELTIEQALKELWKIFRGTTATIMFSTKDFRCGIVTSSHTFYGSTLTEVVARVRAWKDNQS